MTMNLSEQYERVQCQRMDAGMESETYEEFLERRIEEGNSRFREMERAVAEYLDSVLNTRFYREEVGYGDREIENMQGRARENLKVVFGNHGWDLSTDEDGFYTIKNTDGRYINLACMRYPDANLSTLEPEIEHVIESAKSTRFSE